MLWVCLAAIGFIVYTYALFPALLHLRAMGKSLPPAPDASGPDASGELPTVSVVIAAHNEKAGLPGKLESLETLDYPADKIEWIIVSDGSSDGTDAYLSDAFAGHDNRRFLHYSEPKGKCGALNEGVALATGDIILFMDARQVISSNAAMALVPYLAHPAIGAVTGELVLSKDSSLEASNFGLYWQYEKWIRDNESRLFSTTGVTGALYAIRRKDFSAGVSSQGSKPCRQLAIVFEKSMVVQPDSEQGVVAVHLSQGVQIAGAFRHDYHLAIVVRRRTHGSEFVANYRAIATGILRACCSQLRRRSGHQKQGH